MAVYYCRRECMLSLKHGDCIGRTIGGTIETIGTIWGGTIGGTIETIGTIWGGTIGGTIETIGTIWGGTIGGIINNRKNMGAIGTKKCSRYHQVYQCPSQICTSTR